MSALCRLRMELVAQQPTQESGHETIANRLVAGSDYARVTESLGWEVGTGPLHWPGFKFFLCHSFAVWPKINDTYFIHCWNLFTSTVLNF